MDTFHNKFEPPNSFLGKSNSSRRHRKVQEDDNTGVDNAVNSAVYSTLIFIPGVIGFIFVCIRTHRKTKLEEKQLRELERRKLSLRDDDVTWKVLVSWIPGEAFLRCPFVFYKFRYMCWVLLVLFAIKWWSVYVLP